MKMNSQNSWEGNESLARVNLVLMLETVKEELGKLKESSNCGNVLNDGLIRQRIKETMELLSELIGENGTS